MIFPFTHEQAEFIQSTFGVDPKKDFTDDEQLDFEDQVTDYLQMHGINEVGNGENEIGTMCADIMAVIAQND